MNTNEVLKLALVALESCGQRHISDGGNQWHNEKLVDEAIAALREALAHEALDRMAENARYLGLDYEPAQQQQQEPVAWLVYENWRKHSLFFTKEGAEDFKNASQRNDDLSGNLARWRIEPLYTSPPAQRTWVGLTDEERFKVAEQTGCMSADWLDVVKATEIALQIKNQ